MTCHPDFYLNRDTTSNTLRLLLTGEIAEFCSLLWATTNKQTKNIITIIICHITYINLKSVKFIYEEIQLKIPMMFSFFFLFNANILVGAATQCYLDRN